MVKTWTDQVSFFSLTVSQLLFVVRLLVQRLVERRKVTWVFEAMSFSLEIAESKATNNWSPLLIYYSFSFRFNESSCDQFLFANYVFEISVNAPISLSLSWFKFYINLPKTPIPTPQQDEKSVTSFSIVISSFFVGVSKKEPSINSNCDHLVRDFMQINMLIHLNFVKWLH